MRHIENFPPKLFRPLIHIARVPGLLGAVVSPLRLRAAPRLPFAYGLMVKRAPLPHDLIDDWMRAFRADRGVRRDTEKVTRGLDSGATVEAARKLQRFDKPTLLAFAADDRLFPVTDAQRLAATMPHARVEVIPDSRTWVMLDQPDVTAGTIGDFVRATGRRQAGVAGSQSAG